MIKEDNSLPAQEKTISQSNSQEDSWELFREVWDSTQAGVVEGLLKSNRIPVLIRAVGGTSVSRFVLGFSTGGVQVWVPHSFVEQAEECMQVLDWDAQQDAMEYSLISTGEEVDETDRITIDKELPPSDIPKNKFRILMILLIIGIVFIFSILFVDR